MATIFEKTVVSPGVHLLVVLSWTRRSARGPATSKISIITTGEGYRSIRSPGVSVLWSSCRVRTWSRGPRSHFQRELARAKALTAATRRVLDKTGRHPFETFDPKLARVQLADFPSRARATKRKQEVVQC